MIDTECKGSVSVLVFTALLTAVMCLFVADTSATSSAAWSMSAEDVRAQQASDAVNDATLALARDSDDPDAMVLAWSLLNLKAMQAWERDEAYRDGLQKVAVQYLQRALSRHPEHTLLNLAGLGYCHTDVSMDLCVTALQQLDKLVPDNAYGGLHRIALETTDDAVDAALERLAKVPYFESFWLMSVRRMDSVMQRLEQQPEMHQACARYAEDWRGTPGKESQQDSEACLFHRMGMAVTVASTMSIPVLLPVTDACRGDALLLDQREQRCRAAMLRIQAEPQSTMLEQLLAIDVLSALADDEDGKEALAVQQRELRSLSQATLGADEETSWAWARQQWDQMVNRGQGEAAAARAVAALRQDQAAMTSQGR